MGCIIEVYQGRDSVLRSIKLTTSNGELSRLSAYCAYLKQPINHSFLTWQGRIYYVKTQQFLEKTWLPKLCDKDTGAVSLHLFLSLYCWPWVNTSILGLGNKDVLNMCLPLFLCLLCWLWVNMYGWNRDSFISNILCFILQLIFIFTTLICVSTLFFVILEKMLSLIVV